MKSSTNSIDRLLLFPERFALAARLPTVGLHVPGFRSGRRSLSFALSGTPENDPKRPPSPELAQKGASTRATYAATEASVLTTFIPFGVVALFFTCLYCRFAKFGGLLTY